MKTNRVINDQLISEALQTSGCKTQEDAAEQGLRLLVQRNRQQAIRELRGEIRWEDDLDAMRSAE